MIPGKPLYGATTTPYADLSKTYDAASEQWKQAKAWRSALQSAPRQACNGKDKNSFCSAGVQSDAYRYSVLMLATSPGAYSSLQPAYVGAKRVISGVRDQRPCSACTAFAAVAAAEAAVASATGQDVSAVGRLSAQDLYFCGPTLRTCNTGGTISEVLGDLTRRQLLLEECMPYAPDVSEVKTQEELCRRTCNKHSQLAAQGSFDYVPISGLAQAQRHIRDWGGVITRLDIYSDFAPFFQDFRNQDKVYRPGPNATVVEQHAVLLVGYDNDQQFWWVRNSWSDQFALQGNFKIAFGVAGVLNNGDTFGVVFRPDLTAPSPLKLAPSRTAPNCSEYKAMPGDYLSKVAARAGIDLEKLLLDNLGSLRDLDAPLEGKALLLCSVQQLAGRRGPAEADLYEGQLRALLGVKAAVDRTGSLAFWSAREGAGGGYCSTFLGVGFPGVQCDAQKNVVSINLFQRQLGGALPPGAVLKGLPFLRSVDFSEAGINGTLPGDWGRLAPWLEDIRISGNLGLTGSLPKSWSGMSNLTVLYLHNNNLRGPLPPELSNWTAIEYLALQKNGISGTLPAAWSKMKNLKKLRLYENMLTGTLPPELGPGWSGLEHLELQSNMLSGQLPPAWSKMTHLKDFRIFRNKLSGSLSPDLGRGWRDMEHLELSGNSFSGPLPREWGPMRKLQVLYLHRNRLSGPLPPELGDGWSAMQDLQLGLNAFTGPLPGDAWLKMTNLKDLRIGMNQLTGPLPRALWPSLRWLELSNNRLGGTLPEWPSMRRLDTLNLAGNQLVGTIPKSWGASDPKFVDLQRNPGLRGCLPKGFERFAKTNLCDGTGISCAVC